MCMCVCVCYLAEGQTVFVLVFIFDLEVVQRFALRWSLAQRTQQLDVTRGQETMTTVELAVVPVVVHLASQDDDVTLGKLEIAWFFAFVGIEGFPARQRWDILKNRHRHLILNKQQCFIHASERKIYDICPRVHYYSELEYVVSTEPNVFLPDRKSSKT